MKNFIIVITIVCLSLTISLNAKDIQIVDKPLELSIKKKKLILLNFPFEIKTEKNLELFGSRKHVDIRFKDKSVYFVTSVLPLKMLVYGGDKPIYLEFDGKKRAETQKVFNFYNGSKKEDKLSTKRLGHIDNKIISMVKNISDNGEIDAPGFYEKKIERVKKIKDVEIMHKTKFVGDGMVVDKYKVYNQALNTRKLREMDFFKKDMDIIAVVYGNGDGILEYGWYTWAYIFRHLTENNSAQK